MARSTRIPQAAIYEQHRADALRDVELAGHRVIKQLQGGELRNVVVLAGAGISVSAGVPDFRSPGTGLYDNLEHYDLPSPEDVFTLSYFRRNPWPFTLLAKELWPRNLKPTPAHFFVRLLEQKGALRRHYTQNIDGLDRAAGISNTRLVHAHGAFGNGRCIDCGQEFSEDDLRRQIFSSNVTYCDCGGLVKPDIVFFGEDLPKKFFSCSKQDLQDCSLLICMGTSLQVEPVASLAHRVPHRVPRILINRDVPDTFRPREGDLVLLGECDDQVFRLAHALGWGSDLQELIRSHAGDCCTARSFHNATCHRLMLVILMVCGMGLVVFHNFSVVSESRGSITIGMFMWVLWVAAIASGFGWRDILSLYARNIAS